MTQKTQKIEKWYIHPFSNDSLKKESLDVSERGWRVGSIYRKNSKTMDENNKIIEEIKISSWNWWRLIRRGGDCFSSSYKKIGMTKIRKPQELLEEFQHFRQLRIQERSLGSINWKKKWKKISVIAWNSKNPKTQWKDKIPLQDILALLYFTPPYIFLLKI